MKKLTRSQIESLPVPAPPHVEQRAIALRIEAKITAARALVASLEKRLAEIELLPAALLR